jgi:hypothetical protein
MGDPLDPPYIELLLNLEVIYIYLRRAALRGLLRSRG